MGDTLNNYALCGLITVNVLAIVLETSVDFRQAYDTAFRVLEIFTVAAFTVEYLARVWAVTADERYRHPLWSRLRWAITPLALVDLIAIAPFYLASVVNGDLRILRVVRLFRLLKFTRYSKTLQSLGRVFVQKRDELAVVLFALSVLLISSATVMYLVERGVQPDHFGSIPAAMWWAVATLTTVGYGDVYPITALGRCMGAVIAVCGIGFFALPAGILGSGFVEEMQRQKKGVTCPHCGKELR